MLSFHIVLLFSALTISSLECHTAQSQHIHPIVMDEQLHSSKLKNVFGVTNICRKSCAKNKHLCYLKAMKEEGITSVQQKYCDYKLIKCIEMCNGPLGMYRSYL